MAERFKMLLCQGKNLVYEFTTLKLFRSTSQAC